MRYARDLDLRGVGGIGDRRGHHIGGQRQIGRLKLEALIFGRGEIALNRTRRLAEDVGRERHGDIRIMERIEQRRRPARRGALRSARRGALREAAELRRRHLRARHALGQSGRRKEGAHIGFRGLPRLAKRRFGGRDVWMIVHRLGHERRNLLRAEQSPPFPRNVAARNEPLCAAARDGRRLGDVRRLAHRIARAQGRIGRGKVGAHSAAGKRRGKQKPQRCRPTL